jgi:hypothetical protein
MSQIFTAGVFGKGRYESQSSAVVERRSWRVRCDLERFKDQRARRAWAPDELLGRTLRVAVEAGDRETGEDVFGVGTGDVAEVEVGGVEFSADFRPPGFFSDVDAVAPLPIIAAQTRSDSPSSLVDVVRQRYFRQVKPNFRNPSTPQND